MKNGNERLKIKDNVELILTDKDGNIKHSEKGFSYTIKKKEEKADGSNNTRRN